LFPYTTLFRSIPAPGILFRRRKMNCGGMPSIDVSLVGTKCGHLELEIVFQNDDHAKMRADCIGPWKNSLHNFRSRIGGDVVVFWRQAADHIAHTTTGEVCDVDRKSVV